MDDLMLRKGWGPLKATTRAALAKTLFTLELARRMQGTGVTANTFHPGFVRSGLPGSLPWYMAAVMRFAMLFMSRETKTGIALATSPALVGQTGKLFVNGAPAEIRVPYDLLPEAARLWEESARLVGAHS